MRVEVVDTAFSEDRNFDEQIEFLRRSSTRTILAAAALELNQAKKASHEKQLEKLDLVLKTAVFVHHVKPAATTEVINGLAKLASKICPEVLSDWTTRYQSASQDRPTLPGYEKFLQAIESRKSRHPFRPPFFQPRHSKLPEA